MTQIERKYFCARNSLNNGDIILFRGNDFIDKAIQMVDKAYYNHIGMVWKADDRYLICDATAGRGVNIDFLSTRVAQEVDFRVLRVDRPPVEINDTVRKMLVYGDKHFGYNYAYIAELFLQKTFHISVNISEKHAFICSIYMKQYMERFKIMEPFITPQDFVRIQCKQLKTIIQ